MSVLPVPAHRLWLLVLGFGAWCSALITVYVLHSVGCTFAWSALTNRLAWVGHPRPSCPDRVAMAQLRNDTCRFPALGPTGSFLHWVIVWTLLAAVVTIVFTLGPTLLLTSCT